MADDARTEGASRWDGLTATGAGTRMGKLLRRYWWPIAGASELDHAATKPVRLLGEDLVLFKDLSGGYGLLDRHCRHRRADLTYGYVEQCGLRCNYHGWLYGADGRCLEQPYEDAAHPETRFKDEVRIKAYPVEERGGMLWAYLGPEPRPLVPNWEFFTWKNGFHQIVLADIPCNWFQCQENSIDPVHFEWTHSQLERAFEGRHRPLFAEAPQGRFHRSSSTASNISASARTPATRTGCGRSGASVCGRTRSSPAITASSACRSTTRTRSRSPGISRACRASASLMSRAAFRPGAGPSPTPRPGAGSRATS